MTRREAITRTPMALSEPGAKALIRQYGVSTPRGALVTSSEQVQGETGGLRAPFVVKVVSADILHKSDVGGVRMGLQTCSDVADAIRSMAALPGIQGAAISGWLVEEMVPAGREIVVGGVVDENFGPMIMVGLGGVFVELLADVSFRICPIDTVDAEEMLEELRAFPILRGARGLAPTSLQSIVDVLMKIGGPDGLLMARLDDIAEIDLNPLIVTEQEAIAVDARVVLSVVRDARCIRGHD